MFNSQLLSICIHHNTFYICFLSRNVKYNMVNKAYIPTYMKRNKKGKGYGLIDSVAQRTLIKHIALYNLNPCYSHEINKLCSKSKLCFRESEKRHQSDLEEGRMA